MGEGEKRMRVPVAAGDLLRSRGSCAVGRMHEEGACVCEGTLRDLARGAVVVGRGGRGGLSVPPLDRSAPALLCACVRNPRRGLAGSYGVHSGIGREFAAVPEGSLRSAYELELAQRKTERESACVHVEWLGKRNFVVFFLLVWLRHVVLLLLQRSSSRHGVHGADGVGLTVSW